MSDPYEPTFWSSRPTFAGIPFENRSNLGRHDVVIVGAPVDWGATYRAGTRWGPRAIREADALGSDGSRPHLPTGIDPLEVLDVVDAGDIETAPGYLEKALDTVRGEITAVAASGAIPIVLGGDHSITFATAGGVADHYGHGTVALVHFDAHADTGETSFGQLHGHGTPMRRLVESEAIPGHRFVQIGLRGYWPGPSVFEWMKERGMRSYFMSEIVERGLDSVVDDAVAYAADGADHVFVSVDIDVVDPSAAPGTGTPEPGGLTARQLLDTVRRICRDLPVVGCDLVEVSPPYDGPGAITAHLANRTVLEMLNGLAERRVE
ncbi:MAG: agmatinase [Actinomycetota bacterium]